MSNIEEKVIDKIRTRAEVGKSKYGVTMERGDLSELDWLIHAQEEVMDLAIYLEKLIQSKQMTVPVDKKSTSIAWPLPFFCILALIINKGDIPSFRQNTLFSGRLVNHSKEIATPSKQLI